jgi:hypothetical protein
VTDGVSEVFSSMLHEKGIDWALQPMVMAITENPSSTMKTNIIIFTLTFFKPYWRSFTSGNKL